jgi:prepilin-type processing-associated H-X9-DG protein
MNQTMTARFLLAFIAAGIFSCGVVFADGHVDAALERAEKAAQTTGDSGDVREHAEAALKHIEAAKAQGEPDHAKLVHLLEAEKNTKQAIEQAKQFNTTSAKEEMRDAATELKQAR